MYIEFEADNLPECILGSLKEYYYPECLQIERSSYNDMDYYAVTINEKKVVGFYIFKQEG